MRLYPALLSGALIFLVASLARELGGSGYASFLAALGLLISIFFMRTYTLFQPVCTEIFLWTLAIYVIIKYVNTRNDKFLILFGIIAGLALLNKYLAGILFVGLLVIIPFTKYRDVFTKENVLGRHWSRIPDLSSESGMAGNKGFPGFSSYG